MIVAIPMDAMKRVYHKNPCTATLFAFYEVKGERSDIRYRHIEDKLNPWETWDGDMVKSPIMKECGCDTQMQKDPRHISEHYALLQVLGKCSYLIVNEYCLNIRNAIRSVGIKIHKIPPFVKTAEEAINHFIIGAEIADHVQNIHPAS